MYGKVNILTWYAELEHIGATLVYRMQVVRFVLSSVAKYKYFVSNVRNIPSLSINLWSLNSNHSFKVVRTYWEVHVSRGHKSRSTRYSVWPYKQARAAR